VLALLDTGWDGDGDRGRVTNDSGGIIGGTALPSGVSVSAEGTVPGAWAASGEAPDCRPFAGVAGNDARFNRRFTPISAS
jgi:hypothetical protein